jgi:phospholipase C
MWGTQVKLGRCTLSAAALVATLCLLPAEHGGAAALAPSMASTRSTRSTRSMAGAAVSAETPDSAGCRFHVGAPASETLPVDRAQRAAIPITHVVVLMQENRSFDHYFGRLQSADQPDADGFPPDFTNPDGDGRPVAPFHLPTTCFPRDPPHQWRNVHAQWNGGQMNGFVTSADDDDGDGRFAMGYYDGRDLPYYYWLAGTFAIADRYFSAAQGGTWPNRQFLYAATSQTPRSPSGLLSGARTIFDLLDRAHVPWRVYGDGPPRQDCIGWRRGGRGLAGMAAFRAALASGNLPPVSFIDPYAEDEHPPADVQRGERWARGLYGAFVSSSLWPRLAVFLTYDEGGGFFDHVPPPPACPPDGDRPELDRRGGRVPFIVISPWARPHHVSHVVHDHTSILRFIELLHDLPALTDRDANADALLDLFDFSAPRLLAPPPPPQAGRNGCRPVALARLARR